MEQVVNILIGTGVLTLVAVFASILLAIAESHLSRGDSSKDVHIDKIEFYLPSYNCGACGHVNCRQVAKQIIDGNIKEIKICKVISEDNANLIRQYCKEKN